MMVHRNAPVPKPARGPLPRRAKMLIAVFVAALLYLVGSVAYSNFGKDTATAEKDQATGQLGVTIDQRDDEALKRRQLARDFKAACDAKDLVSPACDQAAEAAQAPLPGPIGQPGQPGTPGEPGTPGSPGTPGEPGTAGQSGTPGQPGEPGRPGEPGSIGQPGQPGQPGSPGQPGAAGEPGQPGVVGPQGPAGPAGQDGAPGQNGTNGVDGQPGRDGSPAGSMTLTLNGSQYSCTRSGGSDTAPDYTCSGGSSGPPETTTEPPTARFRSPSTPQNTVTATPTATPAPTVEPAPPVQPQLTDLFVPLRQR